MLPDSTPSSATVHRVVSPHTYTIKGLNDIEFKVIITALREKPGPTAANLLKRFGLIFRT